MTAVALLLSLTAVSWAAGPGTSVAPLFQFNWGARPAAMAGAFVAAADDVNASLWNPGGLAFVPQPDVSVMHASLYQGITFDQIAAAVPVGTGGGLGGHFAYMNTGPINRTVEDAGGSFDALNSGGSFHDSEFKLNLSAAGAPIEWLGLGGSLDYFRDSVDQNSADGVMVDFGAMARAGVLTYGLSLQNAGPQVRGLDTPPTMLRMGIAARPNDDFLVSFEYDYRFASYENIFALGAEYALAKALTLRMGLMRPSGAGSPGMLMTGGFGTAMGPFTFDYAFSPYGELGSVNQVALAYHFGPKRGKAPRPAPEPVPTKKPDAEITPEDHFMRADVMIEAKNYARAKEELAAALSVLASEDRRRIRYFDRMGIISAAEGDIDAAEVFFGDGLRLGASLGLSDPDVAEVYAGMGQCLAAKGNISLAIRFLEKALEFGPSPKTKAIVQAKLKELKAKK